MAIRKIPPPVIHGIIIAVVSSILGIGGTLVVQFLSRQSSVLTYQTSTASLLTGGFGNNKRPFKVIGTDGTEISAPATTTMTFTNTGSAVLRDIDMLVRFGDNIRILSWTIADAHLSARTSMDASAKDGIYSVRIPFLNPSQAATIVLFLDGLPSLAPEVDTKQPGLRLEMGTVPAPHSVLFSFIMGTLSGLVVGVLGIEIRYRFALEKIKRALEDVGERIRAANEMINENTDRLNRAAGATPSDQESAPPASPS